MKNRQSPLRTGFAAILAAVILPGACLVAEAQSVSPPSSALPYGATEVVKLYRGGINKEVIISYINSTALPYHLNADGIIYLHSLGLPQEITEAMMLRDGQSQQQQSPPPQFTQPQSMPMPPPAYAPYGAMAGQPQEQVVVPSAPVPPVTVAGAEYSGDYGYPYYPYYPPYCGGYYGGVYGGWPVGWGWGGWGWGRGLGGWGYGGFRGGGGFHGGGGHR